MRKLVLIPALVVALQFCGPPMAQAQSTLYVSSVTLPSAGSSGVASNAWLAHSFVTGNFPGAYALDSVQLRMNMPSGTPAGIGVSIYPMDSGYPGAAKLGSLSGPDPVSAGVFSYSATGISLQPSTTYFVVVTAGVPTASGAFAWSIAGAGFADTFGGWTYGPFSSMSSDGELWTRTARSLQFAVFATPVPEPSSLALLGFGGLCLAACFIRRGASK